MLKKQYDYVTVLRAIAIFMVIVLHCICEYYYDFSNAGRGLWYVLGYADELMRTGVPLFFMISGFLLLKDDITDVKGFYKKRILKVGIPFIIYDIFYYICSYFDGNRISVAGFLGDLFNNGSSYHFWFVYSIIFIYLLMPFLQMIVKRCNIKMLWLLVLLATFQTTIRPFINILCDGKFYIYLTDDGFMGYIGYVILGYILGTYDFSKKSRWIIYALGLITFVITPMANMHSVITEGKHLITGGYTINHYIEAAAIFTWFKYNVHSCNMFISKLSALSFGAYLIHVFILEKLVPISFDLSPSAIMLIWIGGTTVLSFGWSYIESTLTSLVKRILKKTEYNNSISA